MKIEDWLNGQTPLSVVCVLKRSGPYDFNYVKILSQGVRRHLFHLHRFICLTDADLLHRDWFRAHRIQCRPLIHDWSSDWSKIELFRPGLLNGRVLYFDLDLMVTGSLFSLGGYRGPFAMADNVETGRGAASSVMMWAAGRFDSIYERFIADPALSMDEAGSSGSWIASACRKAGIVPDRIQDLVPGLLGDIRAVPGGAPLRTKPPGVGLISFKNGPKPHELTDTSEFIRDHWV
jgi:hypothetical protein